MKKFLLAISVILLSISSLFALTPRQEQELFKNIGEIKGQLYQIDKRFEDINKRFDDINENINKRFDQVDHRFTELRMDMNSRFEQLYTFLWIICGIFTTLVGVVIGFAYWDRRTVLYKAKEDAKQEIDEYDKVKVNKMLEALRQVSQKYPELATSLRNFGLL